MSKKLFSIFVFIFSAIFVLTPSMSAVFADTAPVSPISQTTSQNWAGYVSSGQTYTGVSGTWIVPIPASPANTPTSADATWVGIGGVTSQDLIQSGTQEVVINGTPTFTAWIEGLPNYQQTIPLTIRGGDSVSVSLTEQTTNEWTISFTDNTTGQNYQITVPYTSSHSSAEWIEEMPLAVGARNRASFIPLDDFGTVQFETGATTINGTSQTIAGSGAQPMTMTTTDGSTLASPSSLTGNAFLVTRSMIASSGTTAVQTFVGQGRSRQGRNGNGVQGYVPRTRMVTRRGFSHNFNQRIGIIFLR
jgi:hypothetical protein